MGKSYWKQEIHHSGLNKYRVVKAETRWELEQKVNAILAQWDEQWKRTQERELRQLDRVIKQYEIEESISSAEKQTKKAEKVQFDMDAIVTSSLKPKKLNFDKLKNFDEYSVDKPKQPKLDRIPVEPFRCSDKYNPKVPFLMKLSKKKMDEYRAKNDESFANDFKQWEDKVKEIESINKGKQDEYESLVEKWEKDKAKYLSEQEQNNKEVDNFKIAFSNNEVWAIEKYVSLLLSNIKYPFFYEQNVETELYYEHKKLIVDLMLPNKDDIPTLKSVTYVKSKNEFKETFYPETYLKKKYDSVIYQIVLQALNYIFSLIDKKHVESVVINGKVNIIDKTTGKNIEPYILSIAVDRASFEDINLSAVDPKMWFKSAKGLSAISFANVVPIAPIIRISKEDDRFVDGYEIVDSINESVNLALLDWQDFENLIREIFEQEFNVNGGEVKITQASRDGGVDAVAFDPDPIRGGKIVIQAKRYTNVVGVSAVRDLYGTVLNEGATKGILVTTSTFGNDSYEFAKGKPITLMDGANLLFLLEKHGHKARIDIKEAKKILRDSML